MEPKTMTETPQDFDFDAWMDDAERPERAVTVYQRAGLIADLDRLGEQINNADLDGIEHIEERRLGERTESQRLTAEYQRIAQQFHDSALTIRVQGHDDAEKAEIIRAHPGLDAGELGSIILAEAITSPKVTPKQLQRLAKTIGEAQFNQIPVAYQRACTEIPTVSADFLPKRSSLGDGGES
jgi:hypothetical protein